MKTKEEIIKDHLTCVCDEMYKSRKMIDPNCALCDLGTEIGLMMEEYKQQPVESNQSIDEALDAVAKEYGYSGLHDVIFGFRISPDFGERSKMYNDLKQIIRNASAMTGKEIPTDEEIEKQFTTEHFHYQKGRFYRRNSDKINGAKWMRDKLLPAPPKSNK